MINILMTRTHKSLATRSSMDPQ